MEKGAQANKFSTGSPGRGRLSNEAMQHDRPVVEIARNVIEACRAPLDYLFVHVDAVTQGYAALFLGCARIILNAIDYSRDVSTLSKLCMIWHIGDSVLLVVDMYAPDSGFFSSRTKHLKTLVVFMNPRRKAYNPKLAECYAMLAHQVNQGDYFSIDRAKSLVKEWAGLDATPPVSASDHLEIVGRTNVRWVNENAGAIRAATRKRSNTRFRASDVETLRALVETLMVSGVSPEEYERLSRTLVAEAPEGPMQTREGAGAAAGAGAGAAAGAGAGSAGEGRDVETGAAMSADVEHTHSPRLFAIPSDHPVASDHIVDCFDMLPPDASLQDALTAAGLRELEGVLAQVGCTTLADIRFVEPEDFNRSDVPEVRRRKFLYFKKHVVHDPVAACFDKLPPDASLQDALTAAGLREVEGVLGQVGCATLADVRFVEPEDFERRDAPVLLVVIRRKFLYFKEQVVRRLPAK
jgi:hypothetical protein